MRLESGRISRAIEFVSAFGGDTDAVVFTPQGKFVRISVQGNAYAEYYAQWSEPLAERFAVPLRTIPLIVRELQGDDLCYRRLNAGNIAGFSAGRRSWSINACGFGEPRPEVQSHATIEWDSTFSSVIRIARACAANKALSKGGCLDCVSVERKPNRRTVASTNTSAMVVVDEEIEADPVPTIDDEDEYDCEVREQQKLSSAEFARVLIRREDVPLVERTCDGGGSVTVRIGTNHYSVESGRKAAIFPLRAGVTPRWRDEVRKASSYGKTGHVTFEAADIHDALSQTTSVSRRVSIEGVDDGVMFRGFDNEGELLEILVSADWVGKFPLFRIDGKQLRSLVATWPTKKIDCSFQGDGLPVVFSSSDRKVTAVLAPIVGDSK